MHTPRQPPISPQSADQYDSPGTDYVTYWNGRGYEHAAEVLAIRRLIANRRFSHAVDVGGGYGRLSVLLQEYAETVTLLDPSRKQLDAAKALLGGLPRIQTRLMDAGLIQLPRASVDLVTMVRVMHHLPDPQPTLRAISRVLRPGGTALIEVANLAHAVNRLRYLVKGQKLPLCPVDRRTVIRRNEHGIPFVNHHPSTVRQQFTNAGLHVQRKLSVSNMRHHRLKQALPQRFLLSIEHALQIPLAPLNFGPSIFYLLRKDP
ncbi:class I SAM-dependent methyltransferase [Streptomyces sp. NPDC094438]|uniref:class I SAM-dependent methyltransferase n=1 Tax=Streptomyces sp. NPDC094438 TaxID=3366061 RepID=UPI0038157A7C